MTLYLDTSALVKLYIEEPEAQLVRDAVSGAAGIATSQLGYVELRSALARRRREGSITAPDYAQLLGQVEPDFRGFYLIPVSRRLIADSAELSERHGLRAYDAVHLASALESRTRSSQVIFACWDLTLRNAAESTGLQTLGPRS
ncbi:MAG: type II toxin-antitoxin system VapC family toxin [Candidatus Eremiobacteraeota bacterium]|nr:type II toxin-antitoxin system VapC family toxin [Candidatus Eremiobacteraeota bacterium]